MQPAFQEQTQWHWVFMVDILWFSTILGHSVHINSYPHKSIQKHIWHMLDPHISPCILTSPSCQFQLLIQAIWDGIVEIPAHIQMLSMALAPCFVILPHAITILLYLHWFKKLLAPNRQQCIIKAKNDTGSLTHIWVTVPHRVDDCEYERSLSCDLMQSIRRLRWWLPCINAY